MADRRNNGSPKKPLGTQLFRRTELKFERPVFSAMRENQSCYLLNPHFLSLILSTAHGQNPDLRLFHFVILELG
jgi:hypothetical protein